MSLDDTLRAAVREEVEEAVRKALDGLERSGPHAELESWKARLWRVPDATRLSLDEAAEALGVSTRSVRRYIAADGDRPPLPHRKGPTGLTVAAGDLRTWIRNLEEGERFRSGGRR